MLCLKKPQTDYKLSFTEIRLLLTKLLVGHKARLFWHIQLTNFCATTSPSCAVGWKQCLCCCFCFSPLIMHNKLVRLKKLNPTQHWYFCYCIRFVFLEIRLHLSSYVPVGNLTHSLQFIRLPVTYETIKLTHFH